MSSEVERVIRRSEVLAVVRALRSGHTPRIGDPLDYFIGVYASEERSGAFAGPRNKANKPYRFALEQWHLDEARQVIRGPPHLYVARAIQPLAPFWRSWLLVFASL